MAITQSGRLLYLTSPLGGEYLLINKLVGREAISELYSYELEVLHEENEEGYRPTPIDPKKVLGKPLVVRATQNDGGERYFNGLCIAFHQGKRGPRFSYYRATIVPDVWMLTRTTQSRVFQNRSVVDVLNAVLDGFKFDIEISQTLEPRNYIVQYRETDWDFISRLMEEEGIYYYFEHKADENRLIIADSPQSHRITPSKESLPYMADISELGEEWVGGVHEWLYESRLQTGKLELRDYNFELQDNPLQAVQTTRFTGFPNQDMEHYDLPGGYAKRFDGINVSGGEQSGNLQKIFPDRERTARLRQEQMDANFRTVSSWSDSAALIAGYRFKLTTHPMASNNIYQIVVSSDIVAQQAPQYVTDDTVPEAYLNEFTCMPHGQGHAPFRPQMRTPRPTIAGSQTGIVVGPSGEEIFPDKYGRVKVHFHWDRLSKFDPEASCWLRVATNIAGNKWGTMFIPRVGQEVLIDFLDGDPDRPIITGSVYNPKTMPHYELPKFKTLTYIKTRTSPDDGKGYNELRFEDKANKEQVFIRSQKRMDVRVRGSLYETCGGSRNEVIGLKEENQPGGNLAITVAGNYDLHVKEARFIGVDGKLNETVKGEVVEDYQSSLATMVKTSAELNANTITLEAKTQITLKVGGNFITIGPSGVTIVGTMTMINSGGSAMGTNNASIEDPVDAETSDTGEPGYLDKPRTGGGGGRKKRTLKGQHYVAPPRPGEDPRMTAIRDTLADSAQGRQALEIYDRYGVEPTFRAGEGSTYDSGTNSTNLDPSEDTTTSALTFVHEMQHAQEANEGTSGDIENQSRDEYVDEMLQEEVDGTVRSIEARNELAENGTDVSNAHFPLENEYQTAYDQAVADARAADPDISDADADAAGRAAGRQRVQDGFENGEVVTSNTNDSYPDYYGDSWDGHHPTGP